MKKAKTDKLRAVLAVIAIFVCAALLGFSGLFNGVQTASASATSESPQYTFEFAEYNVTYDISSNRSIAVSEKLVINYTGTANTGFIKYIPVNGGELVRNVAAYEIVSDSKVDVDYTVYSETVDEVSFICVDIGDTSNKAKTTHTYLVNYDYNLTKAQEGKNTLYLNVIGTDRSPSNIIKSANITLLLPNGYLSGKCFQGALLSETEKTYSASTINGRTAITYATSLDYNEGVTFKLEFENGALSTYFDFTPLWFSLAAVLLLVIMIVVRLLLFNKNTLTPVVNFEAPDNMDPLLMGKLIDNKVNSEDITSMIFYWADKGYLKINLDEEDDPTLIRIVQNLPESCPDYEKLMFNRLFAGRDTVKPSQLRNNFYNTVTAVTTSVNNRAKGLYDSKSIGVSIIFAVLGGLLLGVAPLIMGVFTIHSSFLYYYSFLALLPALIIYGVSETAMYYRFKISKNKKILFAVGIVAICAVFTLLYIFIVPSYLMGWLPKLLLCVISCIEIAFSVTIISRTKTYNDQLNQILGFRNFILLAEKDRLEALIGDDPQFYYHILPYAQVLNVSDKWEEKFKDLTVAPPDWLVSGADTAIRFYTVNLLIRNSMVKIGSSMVSRPASSGGSGRGGFSGGGNVGGGHGGGGFRGR